MRRLTEFYIRADYVTDIVGDLIGLTESLTEFAPRGRIDSRRERTTHGRRYEQRTGFQTAILLERRRLLALPGLPRHDAARRTGCTRERKHHTGQSRRMLGIRTCHILKGQYDQRITDEQCDTLVERAMH